jgi:membrane protease subunit HflK
LYINAMQEIYSSVTKVLVESKQGSNMLYLPLDKIMQLNSTPAAANAAVNAGNTLDGNGSVPSPAMPSSSPDSRGRDSRQRDRDLR